MVIPYVYTCMPVCTYTIRVWYKYTYGTEQCQAHGLFIVHTTNIHTFVRYAKEVSVTKRRTGFLCFVKKQFQPSPSGPPIFEAITDISSDAESCEEQNDTSYFLIGVTMAKLWSLF